MNLMRPPATDAELIRSFDARIRALESGPPSWRVGQWVLSDQGDSLIATRPGVPTLGVGTAEVEPITADLARGFIVDIDQAAEQVKTDVTAAVTGTGGPLSGIVAFLTGKWTDLTTADGKATTAGTNVQSTWDRFWESIFGGTVSGKTVSDFKTAGQSVNSTAGTAGTNATTALGNIQNSWDRFWEAIFGGTVSGKTVSDFKTAGQSVNSTASTANTNATTALGIGNTVKTRFDIRVRAGSNAAADLGFENTAMYIGVYAVRSTAQARTGTYSAALTGTGSSTVYVPITVDQTGIVSYTCAGVDSIYFEAYVYGKSTNTQASGGTNGLQLAVIPYDRTGAALTTVIAANQTTTTALNSAWTKVSGTATLPSNAASFAAFVQLTSACNNNEVYYIDDVIVREITAGFQAQATANTGVTNAATAIANAGTAQTAADTVANRLQTRIKAGSNLATDPSFEDTTMYISGGTPVRSTEQARTGTYSVKMTGTGSSTVTTYVTVNASGTLAYYANGSDSYLFEAWIYGKSTNAQTSGGTNGLQLVLATYDRNGSFIANVVCASVTTSTALNSAWTKVSGVATVASTVATIVGMVTLTSACRNGDVYYIDDVVLREQTKIQKLADALVNVHTGGSSSGNPIDGFVTHLQNVWQDLFGHTTPQSVLQDSAIPDITKDMSSDLDALYTAHVDAVGSGACMVRTSTATVTISTGGTVRNLPTSFFGTNTVSSADITSDLTNAKFTVSLDGWYRCDLCLKTNSTGFTNAWNFAPVLLKNGSAAKYGNDGFDAGAGGGANSRYIASSFEVYLVAGDYVQAGFNADNGTGTISNFLTGEATGTQSYFSISLSNRSLA